jgi:uncharacterized protein YkwD
MLVAIVLIGGFVLAIPYFPAAIKEGSDFFSQLVSSVSRTTQTSSNVTDHSYSPLIQNGSANIQFPSDYATLEAYALRLINFDRANYSVSPVTLSNNQAGQQHADSMLRYDYFSHYDTQGFKPYMRYSLLRGTGADAENVAFILDPSAQYSTSSAESAIKALENAMMNNDTACCNNGHRENILNPLHNRVSIGVAYDTDHIYFDEEFENDYVNLSYSISSGNVVTLGGTPISPSVTGRVNSIYIAFDDTPQSETPAQLNSGPHEYGPGKLIGGVLAPCDPLLNSCATFSSGTTVYASTWTINSSQIQIVFQLQNFVRSQGPGVYTVYLITGQDTNSAITSICFFLA